jgi:hypothetical protein
LSLARAFIARMVLNSKLGIAVLCQMFLDDAPQEPS